MRRGHRVEGAFSFSVNINPKDFPFDYTNPIPWSVDAHRVFDEILDWRHIEVGEPSEVYAEHGRYDGFEIFGPTPRGSALRIWYVEEQLAWLDRRLEGVISSPTHEAAQEDVREIEDAFTRTNPAYKFIISQVRGYP